MGTLDRAVVGGLKGSLLRGHSTLEVVAFPYPGPKSC